jgi:hypothetical protein
MDQRRLAAARLVALELILRQRSRRNTLRSMGFVVAAGAFAGVVDITFACAYWALKAGLGPQRIFQSVAAGLLGRAAFSGGASTAALGLLLHFFIAMIVAAVYFVAARTWPALWKRPWPLGIIYGIGVYAFMNVVVLPLSAAGRGSTDALWVGLGVLVHAIGIGVPSALAARAALAARMRQPQPFVSGC